MYCKLGTNKEDKFFSYLIAKNPSNAYYRKEKREGDITGKWSYDNFNQYFEWFVNHEPIKFLEYARNENLESYVFMQQDAVCHTNLRAYNDVFRSCLYGKFNEQEVSLEESNKERNLTCLIGPFINNPEQIEEVFTSFNITPTIILDEETELAYMLELNANMNITEFLQKIYTLSLYLTHHLDTAFMNNDRLDKYSNLMKDWIDKTENKDLSKKIIKKFTGFNKELRERMSDNLSETNLQDELEVLNNQVNKVSLHQLKHDLILNKIKELNLPENSTILDYGCGEGKMIKKLKNSFKNLNIYGYDSNLERINRYFEYSSKIQQMNILYPLIKPELLNCDVLLNIEVIEHLDRNERDRMLNIIMSIIQPKTLILTTPNIEYNKVYGMEEGKLRHNGHKIEFTTNEFNEEVVNKLKSKYEVEFIKINPEEELQPSFIIICKLIKQEEINKGFYHQLNEMYSETILELSNYNINKSELANGYCESSFINNHKNISYLGSTIAPVEFNKKYSTYLEHPESAFDYFKSKGINELVCEKKYMGSRAYITVCKNKDIATSLGFESEIIINSRKGYNFFDKNDERIQLIYNDIKDKLIEYDFITLDCEILPWRLKAQGLIDFQFKAPVECTYLKRKYSNLETTDSELFLNSLSRFDKNTDLEIRMFGIVYLGKTKTVFKDKKYSTIISDYINGFNITHTEKYKLLKPFEGNIFKLVEHYFINLNSLSAKLRKKYIIHIWKTYCNNEGEGFVIKANNPINFNNKGELICSELKVRGKEYLRLIYGIYMYQEDYFRKLTNRSIKKKRILSIHQKELGFKIIKSFLNNKHYLMRKYIAGFLGQENVNFKLVDKTL